MPILQRGSSGPDVQTLQQRLSDLGFDPNGVDGTFGPGTEAAVRAFQAANNLTVDGRVGPNTLAALQGGQGTEAASGGGATDPATTTDETSGNAGPSGGSKILNENDYQQAATLLNCDVPAIKAVAEVESRGAGFLPDGRPKILFERHKFHSFTGGQYDASHADISNPKQGGYGPEGAHQWDRFNLAAGLNRNAAIKACSWGKFQVMGFNFQVCGFSNLDDFYNAMQISEGEHLKAFLNYIDGTHLGGALRNHQWATLAAGYNGPKYKENNYDTNLAKAYAKYSA